MLDELQARKEAAQARLEQAVGEGRLTLDEYTDRVAQVWAATSTGMIDSALSDLPAPLVRPEPAATRMSIDVIFDDVKRSGRFALSSGDRVTGFFGDVKLDLRQAVLTEQVLKLNVSSVFGDVRVTVPEGIEVEVTSFTLLGDRDIQTTSERVPGSPRLLLKANTIFGDIRVRSGS
ncbi:DUF1707 SHOCT-like domain-containing protein [Amycolatopsis cihanbeyliensis]|uniref:Cell wall-active antibiotic response 4TMS protein YvqF n=1 Tax=Amycolatopsis cihanbeyliensis TaxID=1128664 RepID=A0A542CU03_AMYCI|nr:DUF1707 domain-containing protein [Amycolatopsis cihanbeyliensis]TQI94298.1 cell wall-active antibiotic response 4TMS protein YvqF [Amycolatopsis cihanbeyliensis]